MIRFVLLILFLVIQIQSKNCTNFCNFGTCNNTTGVCDCFRDYYGPNCLFKYCPTFETRICNNQGNCNTTTGICTCNQPFSGLDCSVLCPQNCTNRGRCENGDCYCFRGYSGKDCSRINCFDMSCNGKGVCDTTRGICKCDERHSGISCEQILCPMNCTGNGNCDLKTGKCSCYSEWMGDSCSININVKDLELINYISRFIGTSFVIFISIVLCIISFSNYQFSYRGFNGNFFALMEFIQFIGIAGFIGKNLDPLFLKFSYSFSWANFIFNLGLLENPTQLDRGPIFFIDNFFIICIFVLVCGVISTCITFYKHYFSNTQDIMNSYILLVLRILLISYTGLSISVNYEISLAFQGRIIIIAFLGAFSIFFVYILGFPIATFFFLRKGVSPVLHLPFSPLFSDFKETMVSFGIVVLCKKFLFGLLVGLFQTNSQDQMIGITLVLISYMGIVLILKPFNDELRNYTEIFITFIQIINIIFELIMWIFPRLITILLMILNILSIIALIIIIIIRLIRPKFEKEKDIKEELKDDEEENNSQDALINEKERLNEIRESKDEEKEEEKDEEKEEIKELDQPIKGEENQEIKQETV